MYDSQIYADPVPEAREIPQNILVDDEFSLGMYIEGDNCYFNGSHFPLMQCGYPTQYESSENGFYVGSCDGAELSSHDTLLNHAMDISRSGKPKVEWCKIRAAIKWVISVRKDAAARKNAMLV